MECVDAVFAGPLWRCYGAIWPIDDTSGICVNDSHPIVVVLLWTLLILCWLFIFWGGGGGVVVNPIALLFGGDLASPKGRQRDYLWLGDFYSVTFAASWSDVVVVNCSQNVRNVSLLLVE